jgi:nicotinamidase/pyrazinamidase
LGSIPRAVAGAANPVPANGLPKGTAFVHDGAGATIGSTRARTAMLDGPLVFVDVDTQRDFLEPEGALFVPGSEAILENLARLTDFARARGIPILATSCAHTPDDVDEIARFGPHCMAGTWGQERVEQTAWQGGHVLGPSEAHSGEMPAHLTIEKRAYDVMTHPEAARLIACYNRDRPTFVVYGVATDFCVRAAVEGLLGLDCKVAIVIDAIRAIDVEHEADVLAGLVRKGATLVLTEVVCGESSG